MNSPVFTFRLPESDRQALQRLAEADGRTTSALARKIISDWLRQAAPVVAQAAPVLRRQQPKEKKA